MCVSPGVDPVGGSGPPEELPQVLSDTLPQDVAVTLTLLTAANHELIQVWRPAVHVLPGDDGSRAVAGGRKTPDASVTHFASLWCETESCNHPSDR